MSVDEEFLELYLHKSVQLCVCDMITNVPDDKFISFLKALTNSDCITSDEYYSISYGIQAEGKERNKTCKERLFHILFFRESHLDEILGALKRTHAEGADLFVVNVLSVLNDILDNVFRPPKQPGKWGELKHLIRTKAIDTKTCLTFPSGWGLVLILKDLDEEAVYQALSTTTLTVKTAEMKIQQDKARSYAVCKILRLQTSSGWKKAGLIGLAALGVGVGAAASVPLVIAGLGFGAGGIGAGTFAAWLMSTYGGAVGAGSLCALLQSAGVVGASATTLGAVGGGAGLFSFGIINKIVSLIKRLKYTQASALFSEGL